MSTDGLNKSLADQFIDIDLKLELLIDGTDIFQLPHDSFTSASHETGVTIREEPDTWAFAWMPPIEEFMGNENEEVTNKLLNPSELTRCNRFSSDLHEKKLYNSILLVDKSFHNPYATEAMLSTFGVVQQRSFAVQLENQDDTFLEDLREKQDCAWANLKVIKGAEFARAGQHAAAIKYYDQALNTYPTHIDGLVAKGAALASMGQLRPAIASFERALQLDPECINARSYLNVTVKKLKTSSSIHENYKEKSHQVQSTLKSVESTVVLPVSQEKLYVKHPAISAIAKQYSYVNSENGSTSEGSKRGGSVKRSHKKSKKDKKRKKSHRKRKEKKHKKGEKSVEINSSSTERSLDTAKETVDSHPILHRTKHSLWGI